MQLLGDASTSQMLRKPHARTCARKTRKGRARARKGEVQGSCLACIEEGSRTSLIRVYINININTVINMNINANRSVNIK